MCLFCQVEFKKYFSCFILPTNSFPFPTPLVYSCNGNINLQLLSCWAATSIQIRKSNWLVTYITLQTKELFVFINITYQWFYMLAHVLSFAPFKNVYRAYILVMWLPGFCLLTYDDQCPLVFTILAEWASA